MKKHYKMVPGSSLQKWLYASSIKGLGKLIALTYGSGEAMLSLRDGGYAFFRCYDED